MSLSRRLLHPSLPRHLSAALILFGFAACESDRPPPTLPPAAATETANPELEAEGTFLAGQVQVEILLNRAGFAGRGARASGAGGSSAGPADADSRRDGRSGRGGRGGGRGRGAGSGSALAEGSSAEGDNGTAPHIHPSNLPSLRLHLRLTNLGSAPVEVEVSDFDSDLGNFVVQPDKILLPPNEPVEAEPMTSRLGVASEAIPVTVSLRANGQTEKQILTLRPVKPSAPATGTPAAMPST